ncbi:MAG: ABC transporter ATP-binding protein [Clostridia bacterium]|nr:ABC transporter ATP-binding protein [Clostridia bacterium]
MEREIAIQIRGLKKDYRLGVISGGTLQRDIQSFWARLLKREDPNSKVGSKNYGKNEKFTALEGVDLTVYKGERLGIIGKNGAGKSTLLKLISRITSPTAGTIGINGRVSSMLEVGTGFHGELTGRENIYLNGAILGMSKAEVNEKIDRIIEFSEIEKFIDTPAKRYSSGMYVKLAFSVAAHLDSEIMIMDEVLAVGDLAFQRKCLDKMGDVSREENRTILYVSHNMDTIRRLCDRCIVLEKDRIVFDGNVEKAIDLYSGM